MPSQSPDPPPSNQLQQQQPQAQVTIPADSPDNPSYLLFKRYTAYTFLVAGPILIALPPRKLDLHTAALTTAFLLSANHVTHVHSGRGITDHLSGYFSSASSTSSAGSKGSGMFSSLPTARAEEVQRVLREQKEREREQLRRLRGQDEQDTEENKEQGLMGVARKIWMGGETEGWQKRRAEEERKALEEGKGYGSLIMEHLRDAWGADDKGGKKESESGQKEKSDDT